MVYHHNNALTPLIICVVYIVAVKELSNVDYFLFSLIVPHPCCYAAGDHSVTYVNIVFFCPVLFIELRYSIGNSISKIIAPTHFLFE